MFDTKDDNGCYIHAGYKTYVGFIELESSNNVYLNIDNKECLFKTKDGTEFKVASICGTNICGAKKVRIETAASFKHRDDAFNSISSYLTSLRIYLMKLDFMYSIPLKPKVEELTSHRNCVGTVEIILHNGHRVQFEEKERFHNENGTWYRLYSKENLSINEANSLYVESSAYVGSDEAKREIEAILPKLTLFLNDKLKISYSMSDIKVNISLSIHNSFGLDSRVTVSKRVQFNMDLIEALYEDDNIQDVLMLLEYRGFNDLSNLYKILEIIRSDMGEKNQSKADEKIESENISVREFIKRFTNTCNNDKIIGLLNARHAAKSLTADNKNFLSFNDCVDGMRSLIFNWLDYKSQQK